MSAQARRTARAQAAHEAATAPNAWRCKVEGCPIVDVWHPAPSRQAAHQAADQHYDDRHAAKS